MFQGNANVISTSPAGCKASVLQMFLEEGKQGIDDHNKQGPRKRATLKDPRQDFEKKDHTLTSIKKSFITKIKLLDKGEESRGEQNEIQNIENPSMGNTWKCRSVIEKQQERYQIH